MSDALILLETSVIQSDWVWKIHAKCRTFLPLENYARDGEISRSLFLTPNLWYVSKGLPLDGEIKSLGGKQIKTTATRKIVDYDWQNKNT